jgi:3-methyladenine DNA glycosylase/8-oxoguanine DNA glycosylase
VFPSPLEIIDHGEDFLRQELRLGFRSIVLAESSSQLLEKGFIDDQGNLVQTDLNFEDLVALRGIGPYSANHLMMLTHDFGRIPIDSEVTRYCKEHYDLEPEDIEFFFNKWGEYRFLGYKLSRIIGDTNWTG